MLSENDLLFRKQSLYPKRHKSVLTMAVVFCLIFGGGYIVYQASSIYRVPMIFLDEPVEGALLRGVNVSIRGRTDPDSRLTINGFEIFSDEMGEFNVDLPFQKGFHVIDIKARNKIGKEAKIVRHIVVE